MRKFYGILILVIIIIAGYCVYIGAHKSSDKNGFAIYFVKAESKKGALSYGRNEQDGKYVKTDLSMDSLDIEDQPLLEEKDIKKYNWNTHEIQLTDDYLKNHKSIIQKDDELTEGGSNLLHTKELDAVVIMVNDKRIYCAGFPISPRKSCFPPEYMIKDVSKDTIAIVKNSNKFEKDLRQKNKIYNALKKANILVEHP
ncbi:hypothetical protein ACFIJ5_18390 (plasmid) [Haloimpatiens sp. FM7330]|uniref:hypothetical protein n=1 Tax=Haloimpatiens sp. FM7330 TaxID=3298610 RepID=UPI00363F73DD